MRSSAGTQYMLDKVRLAESRTHKIKFEGTAKAVKAEQGKGKKWGKKHLRA